MSIRDVLKDRQSKRVKDNLNQKEGYKDLLEFIAQRRRVFSDYDVQEEEVKLLNGIKMHVDSGWVVDQETLQQLFVVSGIQDIQNQYKYAVDDERGRPSLKVMNTMQFAYKVACRMGLPDFVFIDDVLRPAKGPGEQDWALDMALYRSAGSTAGNQSA